MKTASKPTGALATNLSPLSITDRPDENISYRKTKIFTRWVTVILGGLIFGCAQTLSYVHTLNLFERHGYTSWQAHLGVIMFEALFFLGAFTTMVFHFIGAKPGIPVRMATLLGAGFVGWSNISYGMEYGRGGVVIGISIILCAIVAELVTGKSISHTGREPVVATDREEIRETEPDREEKYYPAPAWEMEVGGREEEDRENREDISTLSPAPTPAWEEVAATREEQWEEEAASTPTTREEVKKKALEILKAEGELPGRRRLMKETGSPTDWIPRKVLEKLEMELGLKKQVG
ncbi:hypothetical protein ACFQ5F_09515 [Kroppenstedtia eburnea]|uniref:Uncharacterized protein n=1 Tax=Kroppenstedtia eburnea TaxID=714067 RepID=A0A1N7MI48_9BACL|nr:hypothetical protein [Kroppenstedtia eburnea]QKI81589.1 hypothetical protein GXN75_06020 [Kroppenstedtia eburnea]SIS85854.1 hypothetical protein SAMN05421790_106115 [Kroppenstedtia eburnea]